MARKSETPPRILFPWVKDSVSSTAGHKLRSDTVPITVTAADTRSCQTPDTKLVKLTSGNSSPGTVRAGAPQTEMWQDAD